MAEVTAALVMKLRKMSGQGMMDCKAALNETDGDIDKAIQLLRKKGLATLSKRAERETSEGLIITKATDDGKKAVLASLCCETDFVAKSDDFITAANLLGDYSMVCPATEGIDNILSTEIDGKNFNDVITETVSKTGEKMQVGDYARFEVADNGFISTYIHFNKKVGTMVEVQTSDETIADNDELKNAINDIAMHITATKPLALDKSGIDTETIEKEKAIFAEQVKGKPENIIEKIVQGKLNKYYAENCLLSQPFVKDDSKTVEQVIADAAKATGGEAKISRFVRFEVA